MISLAVILIIPEIYSTVESFRKNIPSLIEDLNTLALEIEKRFDLNLNLNNVFDIFNIKFDKYEDLIKNFSINTVSKSVKSIFSITNTVFSGVLNGIIGFIFSLYFLFEKETLLLQSKKVILSLFENEIANYIFKVGKVSQSSFENFLSGQSKEVVILGIIFFLCMKIFNFPNAVAISTMMGLFSFIPIFGALFVTVFGMLIIAIESPILSIWFLVMEIIIQQVEGNIIYPRVVGKSVGLPGLWVLLSVTIFGGAFGIVGMLICVPITSIIYTLSGEKIDSILENKGIDVNSLSNYQ